MATDDAAPWTSIIEGRLPAPCLDGRRCEAVLLSEAPAPDFRVARPASDLELTIVGRGTLDHAVPFGLLEQRGPIGETAAGGTYRLVRPVRPSCW